VQEFMDILPPNLKLELSLVIHKETINSMRFFKQRKEDLNFISWICPLLKPALFAKSEFIFQEGDKLENLFF
jgi:hypothetical protein